MWVSHGFVVIAEALYRDDGAEHLLLDDLLILRQSGHHRGFVEETPITEPPPTRLDDGVVR